MGLGQRKQQEEIGFSSPRPFSRPFSATGEGQVDRKGQTATTARHFEFNTCSPELPRGAVKGNALSHLPTSWACTKCWKLPRIWICIPPVTAFLLLVFLIQCCCFFLFSLLSAVLDDVQRRRWQCQPSATPGLSRGCWDPVLQAELASKRKLLSVDFLRFAGFFCCFLHSCFTRTCLPGLCCLWKIRIASQQ